METRDSIDYASIRIQTASPREQARRAVRLMEADYVSVARSLLESVVAADSAVLVPGKGAVVYWLAQAYYEADQPVKAFDVLRRGIALFEQRSLFDVRLSDAFVRATMRRRMVSEYDRAGRVYLGILQRIGDPSLEDVERRLVARHLQEMAFVLPNAMQRRTGLVVHPVEFTVKINPTPDAGKTLTGWWRKQDPLPATLHNERLQEHLRRVAYARKNYTHEGELDDRGKVYIRLGAPEYKTTIRQGPYDGATSNDDTEGIRPNEFWTYPDVDEDAYYLFVADDSGDFRIVGVNALFPTTGPPELSTLTTVLRKLAAYHGDYAMRASEAFDKATWARNNEEFGIGNDSWTLDLASFVRDMQKRNENEFRKHVERRSERVPPSRSRVGERVGELPIRSRLFRSLTSEGKTRIEVYWSLPIDGLLLTEEVRDNLNDPSSEMSHFILRLAGSLEGPNHASEGVRHGQYRVVQSASTNRILEPSTFVVGEADTTFHVGLQWEQYAMRQDDEDETNLGSVLRRHTGRYDTLRALNDDPATLEMSDLKLLSVPDVHDTASLLSDDPVPQPFDEVSAATPIALNFEVYHLHFNEQEQSRYRVSYELRRTTDEGLFDLFGSDDEERVVTTTTTTAGSRRVEETILIELDVLDIEEPTPIEIAVRIEDEVTGQEVERNIELTLRP